MAKTTKARKKTAQVQSDEERRLRAQKRGLQRVARLHRDVATLAKTIVRKRQQADAALVDLARATLERVGGIPRDLPLEPEA